MKLKQIRKVLVLGCPGSGKSTFAIKLHRQTNLPLYHLDNIWWKADKTHVTRDEFDSCLDEILNRDSWIIDGNYSRTFEKRIAACDTVFFLDYGKEVCMAGITGRIGQARPDLPWIEQELDPELVELVKNYEKDDKPGLLKLFAKYPQKNVMVFTKRDEAEKWFSERQQ